MIGMAESADQARPASRSSSSASSASPARSDEEQATAPRPREGSQETTIPRRISLDSLPTEILSTILTQVYTMYALDGWHDRHLLAPLKIILLNKRIFEVGRPIWFFAFAIPESRAKDPIIQNIVAHRDLSRHARLLVASASTMPFLTHLTVSYDNPDGCQPFFDGLRILRHLRFLKVNTLARASTALDDFALDLDVPSLRELDIADLEIDEYGSDADDSGSDDENDPVAVLLRGLNKLARLRLPHLVAYGIDIPWRTLQELELLQELSKNAVAYSLQSVKRHPTAIVMERIRLQLNSWHDEQLSVAGIFDFLRALSRGGKLSRIHFDMGAVPEIPPSFTFRTVQTLVLFGPVTVSKETELDRLQSSLAVFPSVTSLKLRNFRFAGGSSDGGATIAATDAATLSTAYPQLDALLKWLEQTDVVRVTSHYVLDEGEVRWLRRDRDDTFRRDGWTARRECAVCRDDGI
ncbi:hypothetical protein JCM10296v2_004760 [Rhodotorula toruloides]